MKSSGGRRENGSGIVEQKVNANGEELSPRPVIEADSDTTLGNRFITSRGNLSPSRQKLLRRILDESDETYFLSSRDMGRRYDVDSATIIRTVQALGYEKFADFAHDLREHFVAKITPYSAMKAAEQTALTVADRASATASSISRLRAESPARIFWRRKYTPSATSRPKLTRLARNFPSAKIADALT